MSQHQEKATIIRFERLSADNFRLTLEAPLIAQPEMCSLNLGSMNFGLYPMHGFPDPSDELEQTQVDGASDVTIEGLTIEAGRSSGIEVRGSKAVRIVGCTIRNAGHRAVVASGAMAHPTLILSVDGLLAAELIDAGDVDGVVSVITDVWVVDVE